MIGVAWGILRLVPCSSSANFCCSTHTKNRVAAAATPARIIWGRAPATGTRATAVTQQSGSSWTRWTRWGRQVPSSATVGPALHKPWRLPHVVTKPRQPANARPWLPWTSLAGPLYHTFCRPSPHRFQPLTGLARSLQDRSGALQTFPPPSHFLAPKPPTQPSAVPRLKSCLLEYLSPPPPLVLATPPFHPPSIHLHCVLSPASIIHSHLSSSSSHSVTPEGTLSRAHLLSSSRFADFCILSSLLL